MEELTKNEMLSLIVEAKEETRLLTERLDSIENALMKASNPKEIEIARNMILDEDLKHIEVY